VNKDNGIKYIAADHIVGGLELIPDERLQFTLEGFYKNYSDYPYSVADSVPLSTKSADYGVFGNEEVVSTAEGRAYGIELMGRVRDLKGLNMVFAYTYVRSEFIGSANIYIPTAWDNRHLISVTATKAIGETWDVGFKWRFVGGAPYTPYDVATSMKIDAWDVNGRAYLDYSRYNTERLKAFNQLDIRIDKQFYFSKWSLMLYADVQNILNFKADLPDILVPLTDDNGDYVVDPDDPTSYVPNYLPADAGTILPTIGIIIEI
jgi:hypothetical protein